MNEFIFESVVNADVCTVINEIEYSTNPRKIVTVEQMIKHYFNPSFKIIPNPVKLLYSSKYGKMGEASHDINSLYPTLIDERV